MSSSSSDVLLYAQSKLTRKQAVREIADVVLRANMKPRTVQHALALLKILLPPENTLPSTVDELFGAMLSSENDWRLAQYLIRHRQQPSFVSTPYSLSEYSNSNTSLTAASSSSIPLINQEFNPSIPSTSISSLFLPVNDRSSSSSSSSSSNSNSSNSSSDASDSESSSGASVSASSDEEEEEDEDEDDDDDDDEDERNILFALREAQQQRLSNSSPPRLSTESAEVENHLNRPTSSNHAESSDQRSQLVSSSFNRYPFLGSFKRQRSETSSEESDSEPDLFYSTQLLGNESDDDGETSLDRISNNNTSNNNKSCCFEINGCDLLDGGKRRRH